MSQSEFIRRHSGTYPQSHMFWTCQRLGHELLKRTAQCIARLGAPAIAFMFWVVGSVGVTRCEPSVAEWDEVSNRYPEFMLTFRVEFREGQADSKIAPTVFRQNATMAVRRGEVYRLETKGQDRHPSGTGLIDIHRVEVFQDDLAQLLSLQSGLNDNCYQFDTMNRSRADYYWVDPAFVLFRPFRHGRVGYFDRGSINVRSQSTGEATVSLVGKRASSSSYSTTCTIDPTRHFRPISYETASPGQGRSSTKYSYSGEAADRDAVTGWRAAILRGDGSIQYEAVITEVKLEVRALTVEEISLPIAPRGTIRSEHPSERFSIAQGNGNWVPTNVHEVGENTPPEILSVAEARINRSRVWKVAGIAVAAIALAFTVRLARRNRLARGTP